MKRLTDITVVSCALLILLAPMVLIAVAVRLTSPGPVLHRSPRIGRDGRPFVMFKFRTMIVGTPDVASHELDNASEFLTPIGLLLRRSSLDEIPQLWCILKGDMSLVGPRPALYNQEDLLELRESCGVNKLTPGLTGWAQVNGRDSLSISEKVSFDEEYLRRKSWFFDLKILLLTVPKVLGARNIKH